MSDDILDHLTVRRDCVPLPEWAKRGWLKDVDALTPYFIALLYYPYHGADCGPVEIIKTGSTTDYLGAKGNPYSELKKKCLRLTKRIIEAVEAGELPAKTIDFYEYHWPFAVGGNPGLNPLEYLSAKQGKRKSPGTAKLPTLLIRRDDFRIWLINRGLWHTLKDECLLKKWFMDESPHGGGLPSTSEARKATVSTSAPLETKGQNTQQRREAILLKWLEGKEQTNPNFDRWYIELTHKEVWDELDNLSLSINPDSRHFAPKGDRTLTDFFSKQKLCKFKLGAK